MSQIPLICLVGPTGAGKTAASLFLAKTFSGGVVNLDSRQVYRDFPIITAQPSEEEQSHCAHRLYGFLATEEKMDAGRFITMAEQAIEETLEDGLLPLLVGGTGLYLKALVDGLAPIPKVDTEISQRVWQQVLTRGSETMHAELVLVDPTYAAKIHPNDKQRVSRALEVFEGTGKTLTWWHGQPVVPTRFRALKLGVQTTLDDLTPLLGVRIDLMLEAGALEEARRALDICDNPAAAGWSGIGCAEIYQHLTGKISLDECRALWLKNTRAYAKRQLTWFRKDETIHWVEGKDFDTMNKLVQEFLAK